MLRELRQHPFLFNLLSFHHFPGRKNPVCKICLESVHLVDFFLLPFFSSSSSGACRVCPGCFDFTAGEWQPRPHLTPQTQLLLMSASCSRLERAVFKQSSSLCPQGGSSTLFLKGAVHQLSCWLFGGFLSELFGFCSHFLTTLRLFSDRCHQPCAANSFNPSKL